MLRRTLVAAIVLGGAIAFGVALLFQDPERPFTMGQQVLLYVVSFLPAMGIAMLFDPFPKQKKAEYLKINFYEEK